jgi:hypothetical protein
MGEQCTSRQEICIGPKCYDAGYISIVSEIFTFKDEESFFSTSGNFTF